MKCSPGHLSAILWQNTLYEVLSSAENILIAHVQRTLLTHDLEAVDGPPMFSGMVSMSCECSVLACRHVSRFRRVSANSVSSLDLKAQGITVSHKCNGAFHDF